MYTVFPQIVSALEQFPHLYVLQSKVTVHKVKFKKEQFPRKLFAEIRYISRSWWAIINATRDLCLAAPSIVPKTGWPTLSTHTCKQSNLSSSYSFFLYRLIYNICRCVVQFVMPMLVVLGVYISIFWRLKNRPITKNSTNFKRRRRTNIMVISVSITFFLSWLPLNALNFLLDVESLNKHSKEVRIKRIFFC